MSSNSKEEIRISVIGQNIKQQFTHVSCGDNHTALVTDNGQLFTFGDGRHGKLCLDGDTTMTNHYSPMLSMRYAQSFQIRMILKSKAIPPSPTIRLIRLSLFYGNNDLFSDIDV